MSEWQPIETAPRDGSKVLVYFNHEADSYYDPESPDKLTDYAANAEGVGCFQGKGQVIAVWQDGFQESDGWEDPNGGYWMPGGWFPWWNGEPADQVCNATHWQPLPEPPTSANMSE